MDKKIKGTVFSEYVRMIKSTSHLPWSDHLTEEDMKLVEERILPSAWYPMDSYKRMGLAVFKLLAQSNVQAAWNWGRSSLEGLTPIYKNLVVEGNPKESIKRFAIIQGNIANFELLEVQEVDGTKARVTFKVVFGDEADRAYAHHFGGMLERLVELSAQGKADVQMIQKAWLDGANTVYQVSW